MTSTGSPSSSSSVIVWQTLGVVHGVTVLLVAHTIIEDDAEGEAVEVIRIISARRATPKERKRYEQETR